MVVPGRRGRGCGGDPGRCGLRGRVEKAPEPAAQEEQTAPENTADDAVDDVIDAATDLVSQTPSDPEAPAEYRSALNQADTYANRMHMSKQGIYDQLTSEYGEQFTAEEADYAVSNLQGAPKLPVRYVQAARMIQGRPSASGGPSRARAQRGEKDGARRTGREERGAPLRLPSRPPLSLRPSHHLGRRPSHEAPRHLAARYAPAPMIASATQNEGSGHARNSTSESPAPMKGAIA